MVVCAICSDCGAARGRLGMADVEKAKGKRSDGVGLDDDGIIVMIKVGDW